MNNLPKRVLLFYYPQGLLFFIRVLKNSIRLLDEDLAVTLMARLIFAPLFHDSSIIGRVLSFLYRSLRVLSGGIAILFVGILIIIAAIVYFIAPSIVFLLFIPTIPIFIKMLFSTIVVAAVGSLITSILFVPYKKVWQIKAADDVWSATMLSKSSVNFENLLNSIEVKNLLFTLELKTEDLPKFTGVIDKDFLQLVWSLAKECGARFITESHFFTAMMLSIPEHELLKINRKKDDFKEALKYQELKRNRARATFIWEEEFSIKHLKGVNRGWRGAPTPLLDTVSSDLTKVASSHGFDEFIGRSAVINQVIEILSQSNDRNVLLIGPAGSGKTSLVQSLATVIVSGDAPESIATKRLIQLDLSKLLSNVSSQGQLASRVKGIFEEIEFVEDIVIFIDEIQNLAVGEVANAFNLFSLIIPYLESSKFQFIATIEPENYAKTLENENWVARIFHKVEMPPATKLETLQIVEGFSINLASNKKVGMTYIAIRDLVNYAAKLIHNQVLPDSALSTLDEAVVKAKKLDHGGVWINSTVIEEVFKSRVNVPIGQVEGKQKDDLLHLEQEIGKKMIGQEQAVKAVSDTLRRSVVGLKSENRPIGSFLFVGPTGVGKTELAKILAEIYFKNKNAYIRLDMSEFSGPEGVSRLIGIENVPGELTDAVKNKPYSLILLDEFEKAEKGVLNLFLQILEDGRLTDHAGKTIDFSSTIIIATSNVGSLLIVNGLEQKKSLEEIEKEVKGELLKELKVELLNRFDNVVIFKPLELTELEKIVHLKLSEVDNLLKDAGYVVEFTPELITELAKRGFDQTLGARPLRRLIQDTIEARISRMILENKILRGEKFKAGVELMN